MTLNQKYFALIICLLVIGGCAHSIILLSPKDHYELGNYYLQEGRYDQATDQFEVVRNEYPTSEYATMSQFKLAQTLFDRQKYELAAMDFELFLEFHPAHQLASFAQYHLALSKYKSINTPDRDFQMAREALEAFNTFLILYPDHPDRSSAIQYKQELEDHSTRHELEVGKMYYRQGSYRAAIGRLEPLVEGCHSSELKAELLYYIGKCKEHKFQPDQEELLQLFNQSIAAAPASKWAEKSRDRVRKLKTP